MSGTLLSPSDLATAANLEILMLLKLQAKFRFHIERKHAFDLKLIMLNFLPARSRSINCPNNYLRDGRLVRKFSYQFVPTFCKI